MIGTIFPLASSRLPLMSNWTSAECRSLDSCVAGDSSGFRTFVTSLFSETIWTTPAIAAWKLGSDARTTGLWIRTLSVARSWKSASARMCRALAASPEAMPVSLRGFEPAQPPTRIAAAANASHPNAARFQWPALQPPARAARFRLGRMLIARGRRYAVGAPSL